jgi:hypothetical protein
MVNQRLHIIETNFNEETHTNTVNTKHKTQKSFTGNRMVRDNCANAA